MTYSVLMQVLNAIFDLFSLRNLAYSLPGSSSNNLVAVELDVHRVQRAYCCTKSPRKRLIGLRSAHKRFVGRRNRRTKWDKGSSAGLRGSSHSRLERVMKVQVLRSRAITNDILVEVMGTVVDCHSAKYTIPWVRKSGGLCQKYVPQHTC